MVQYVGDVAIYVTPNKIDRFDDARNKIKDTALYGGFGAVHGVRSKH